MPTLSSSSDRGLRVLRTRVLLLALPGLLGLLYLSHAYHSRDVSTEQVAWPYQSRNNTGLQAGKEDGATQSSWEEENNLRNHCRSEWFTTGVVCQRSPARWTQQDKLDLIWTWNNVTIPNSAATEQSNAVVSQAKADSDLLRYSLRSAQQHLHGGFGKVTLLTPDLPSVSHGYVSSSDDECTHTYHDDQRMTHKGQRPCWLATDDPVYEPPALLHHRQLVCSSDTAKEACQESLLNAPTAATSTLLAAQAEDMSDVRLVVSPHHIFADDVSASDFWSPLYGPAFRLTSDFSADGEINTTTSNQTDRSIASLIEASKLLDQRFGPKTRRKLLDLPQPLSRSILKELSQLWPRALDALTASTSKNVDLPFLAAHYTLEKHQEALLWSFIVAKHDQNGDGMFSLSEAQALLKDLGADAAVNFSFPQVEIPFRSTRMRTSVTASLQKAGLPVRLGHEAIQTSMDGSSLITPRGPDDPASEIVNEVVDGANPLQISAQNKRPVTPACRLARECLQPLIDMVESSNIQHGKPRSAEIFKRVTFQAPDCGDCMILHLTSQSGQRGLSAFLPTHDLQMSPDKTLPLKLDAQNEDFTLLTPPGQPTVKRIDVVTSLLERYAHAVIVQEHFVAPRMRDRLETKFGLTTLEFFNTSSLFSFKQHGEALDPTKAKAEDAWIWTKYVRAWLSLRYPFPMRFEMHSKTL